MSQDPESYQNINNLIFRMASLSQRVSNSIDLELYRTTADSDMATNQYVLEDCFVNLFKDLNEIGLSFNIDIQDYLEDLSMLSEFIHFSELILPNSLYANIKSDKNLRDVITNILSGSLGDDNTVIQTYLSEIGGLDGSPPLRPHLADFADHMYLYISQTDVFTDYLQNLIDLHKQEVPFPLMDEDRHKDYRDHIRNLIGKLSDVVNMFDYREEYSQMTHMMNIIIKDLIAPDNFIDYAYLFLENTTTIPEELIDGYERKWFQYTVSHPWCYRYYYIRKLVPTSYQKIMIACFVYAISDTPEQYKNKLSEFRTTNPDDNIDTMILAQYTE